VLQAQVGCVAQQPPTAQMTSQLTDTTIPTYRNVLYHGTLKTTNTLAATQTTNYHHTASPTRLFVEGQLNPYGRKA
jgi:hypothetical protein